MKKILAMALMLVLVATPAFARSISFKEAGLALWIFVIIGGAIILLQLIPAMILFFSFVGTSGHMILKKDKAEVRETVKELA